MRHASLLLSAVLLFVSLPAAAAADSETTREEMGEIFAALAAVLPDSLDAERFADPGRREAILAALTRLAAGGERLEAHGRSQEASFGFLSRSLARDAEEVRRRFAEGRTDEARFLLHELTQDCVACHSRLPSERDASLGRRLMDEQRVAALPLDQRARLEFATRQFERALDTHEALLASQEYSAADLDLTGILDEYLELCLHVRRDFARPAKTLERFRARADVPARLRVRIGRWIDSLRELERRKREASPLVEAQALLAVAEDRARFPDERDALVYDLAASGELHRFAEVTPAGPDAAFAYFRLGEIESRIGRSFWLSQTETYLETAIRMAPGAPFATQALAQLEEFLISGYTGSAGRQVPADVLARIAELRGLVEKARAQPGAPPARQVAPPAAR
jgi:hypothetical protein